MTLGREARRAIRPVSVIIVALVVAMPVALWLNRTDPSTVPQSVYHEIGTESDTVVMAPLPGVHEVVIEPVGDGEVLGAANELVPSKQQGTFVEAGSFDPNTEKIHISGLLLRVQASIPVPWMQGMFRHVLRHEYGHAFLHDWLAEHGTRSQTLLPFTESELSADPRAYPGPLQPVVAEFAEQPADVFGPPYFTSAFVEYSAESYARFLEGETVPPEMAEFLRDNSRPAP